MHRSARPIRHRRSATWRKRMLLRKSVALSDRFLENIDAHVCDALGLGPRRCGMAANEMIGCRNESCPIGPASARHFEMSTIVRFYRTEWMRSSHDQMMQIRLIHFHFSCNENRLIAIALGSKIKSTFRIECAINGCLERSTHRHNWLDIIRKNMFICNI